jgi:nitrogen regulatory protein PII
MKNVKRIEIITGPIEFRQMVSTMEGAGMTGYAVLRDVLGKGDQKITNSWDSLTSEEQNLMIVTTIEEERLHDLVEAVRPLLKRFGGACLVSDAAWVIH